MENTAKNIHEQLSATANLLRNASDDGKEKRVEVSFVQKDGAITIDSRKFFDMFGRPFTPNEIEKGLMEEKGRLLVKSEVSRSITSDEKEVLKTKSQEVAKIFKNSIVKNAIEKVQQDWGGFSSEIESFTNSLPSKVEINRESTSEEKLNAVMTDWLFPTSNVVDYGDSGLDSHREKLFNILDNLSQKINASSSRVEEAEKAWEELQEIFDDVTSLDENPDDGDGDDSDDGDSDDGDSDDGDGDESDGDESDGDESDDDDSDDDESDGDESDGDDSDDDDSDGDESDGDDSDDGDLDDGDSDDESDSDDSDDDDSDDESEQKRPRKKKPLEPSGKPAIKDFFDDITEEKDGMEKDPSEKEIGSIPNVKIFVRNPEDFKSNEMRVDIRGYVETDEWNIRDKAYLQNLYKSESMSLKKATDAVANAFAFQNVVRNKAVHGYKSGILDNGGLHKIAYQDISIFDIRETPKEKKVTIGILLDQSGSMNGSKIKSAREVVITLVNALQTIKGVELVVYGHTGEAFNLNEVDMIPYLDKQSGKNNLPFLANALSLTENLDGFAIKFVSERMIANNPVNKDNIHCLFLLTDGEPLSSNYCNESAVLHTRESVQKVLNAGQKFFAIGIANAFSDYQASRLFGEGNAVVINDVHSSLSILVSKIKKLFN